MGLYDHIKEVASEKGVTIYRIERDLNLSNGSISKWNNSVPFSDTLFKVAMYLDIPMEELLRAKEEK